MRTIHFKADRRGLIVLLLGGLLVRLVIATSLFPGFDEAYYYLYSRHLSWSYFDHPPLVALSTGVGWWLTGIISPLTIRLGAVFLYLGTLGLFYWTGKRLFSPAVGQMAVAIATLIPLFTLGFGVLTSPDNSLIFFWTATLALAVWEFAPQSPQHADYRPSWRLALFGLTVGLACLSKYHGFVLGLSLVGFCLTSRPYRRVFTSPWLALALLLFGLTLFPLLYWNAQHDWISFQFQLSMRFDGGEPSRFSLLQLVGYWLIHIAYLFPAFGFPLWYVTTQQCWWQWQRWWRFPGRTQQPGEALGQAAGPSTYALLLWLSLPITLGFTLLGGFQQILPAWPAPGFWGLTLLLAERAALAQQTRPRLVRRWLWGSGWVLLPLLLLALLHITTGTFQKPGQYSLVGLMPPSQDASIELINVQQLRQRIAQSPAIMAALEQSAFVFTNEYYLGGYLAMAIHPLQALPITCFSQDPRGFAFWFDQSEWLGQNALYATLKRFDQQPTIANDYRSQFERLDYLGEVALLRGGVEVEWMHFYRASRFKQPYTYPY
ncbi:4-amino-4-deoxy-L-arabinose transferase [filamentous cyanobacterium CCP5]|nr:4-amino-4-deoxy-L-arabinose transferase [filamentous cyanobacterium CCP5]